MSHPKIIRVRGFDPFNDFIQLQQCIICSNAFDSMHNRSNLPKLLIESENGKIKTLKTPHHLFNQPLVHKYVLNYI